MRKQAKEHDPGKRQEHQKEEEKRGPATDSRLARIPNSALKVAHEATEQINLQGQIDGQDDKKDHAEARKIHSRKVI